MEINVFEYAAKNRLRFPHHGPICVEDLYSLTVVELDNIYKSLNRIRKADEEESLLWERPAGSSNIDVKIEIIKHIISEKQRAAMEALEAKERHVREQKLMSLILKRMKKVCEQKLVSLILKRTKKVCERSRKRNF